MMSLSFVFVCFALNLWSINGQSCGKNTVCPQSGICNPITNQCAPFNATYNCGSYGDFLGCADNTGIVVGECGSSEHADCTDTSSSLCPGQKNIYEGIDCNYPALESSFNGHLNTTQWVCGNYGSELSCYNYGGSVLVGVCGSGSHEDCKKECKGYHAILCAQSTYFNVVWGRCQWIQGGKGEWVYCPPGFVAAGHCGSGRSAECGHKDWHSIQCCPFDYVS